MMGSDESFESHEGHMEAAHVLCKRCLYMEKKRTSICPRTKLLIARISSSKHDSCARLPPGPWQLPIIGSLHHLLGSELPYRRFSELSKIFGPLMHLKLGELSLVLVSSPEAAQEIMKTQDLNFATRPLFESLRIRTYNGKTITFAPYGEYWRQVRKICVLELLSQKRVQSFRSIREEEVQNLIASISSISSGSIINLSKKIVTMTNNIATRAVIGDRCKEQSGYLEALDEGIEELGGFSLADLFPSIAGVINMITRSKVKAERSHRRVDQILDDILQQHREQRGSQHQDKEEDLVDVLLRIQKDQSLQFELNDHCIKAIISDMFGAGTETSSTVLHWAMAELVRNPRVMKKAQSEVRAAFRGKKKLRETDICSVQLSYLQCIIKEAMRLHTPIPLLLPRECQKKCKLLGYEIPEKTTVIINAWSIGRDPDFWEDAEEFKPERFEGNQIDFKGANFEFLPFGAGRRICPGMMFALPTLEYALAQLLYFFDWQLPDGIVPERMDMGEAFGITARRKMELYLHAIPHIPSSTT